MNMLKQIKQNVAERRYLIIFSMFCILLCVATIINNYSVFGIIGSVLGFSLCWLAYLVDAFNFRVRSYLLLFFTIFNYVIFGFVTNDLFVALLPYVLIVYLISILEIKGMSYVASIAYLAIIVYHIFIEKTYEINSSDSVCKLVLAFIVAISIEILTSWKLKTESERTEYLEEVIKGLQNAEKGKDEFLANMSHEIRTPLNTISGMTELIYAEEVDDEKKEKLIYIETASKKLQNMVSDIIDYTELQSGKISITNKNYNLSSTINDVINMVTTNYGDKNVEFVIDCDPRIPSGLMGDSEKLYRILCCVLDNAFKFTEKGFVFFKITARVDKNIANLLINIQDSGIGMSAETIEKIFDNYNQANTDRNRKQEGIGIGLVITKKLIDLMNGFIHIESKEKNGTSVTIMIPQDIVDSRQLANLESPDYTTFALYVDGEKYSQAGTLGKYLNTYKSMAEGLGVQYVRCESMGKLKYGLKKGKYSHIFMSIADYLDDQEFFDEIAKNVPIILILEKDSKFIDKEGFRCVYKPFSVFSITDALNGVKSNHRKASEEVWIAPKAKILAVDDNTMNLKVLEGLLKRYKIQMYKAHSGKEAIDMVQGTDFDMIFMDHMMPEMDGVEAFRHIRNISGNYYQTVPIIALTANVVNGAREMFLEEGFQDYVSKPINPSILNRVLLTYIPNSKLVYVEDEEHPGYEEENITQVQTVVDKEVLDIKLGLNYAIHDKELYEELLNGYLSDSVETMKNLKENLRAGDIDSYRNNVHALKSTSLQIGARSLSEKAANSEMICKNYLENESKDIKQDNDEVIVRLAEYHKRITALHNEVCEAVKNYLN